MTDPKGTDTVFAMFLHLHAHMTPWTLLHAECFLKCAHRAVLPCTQRMTAGLTALVSCTQRIDYRPQSCTTACSLVPTSRLLTMFLTARCRWGSCPKQGNMSLEAVKQVAHLLYRGCRAQLAPSGISQPQQHLQPRGNHMQGRCGVALSLGCRLHNVCRHHV